MQQEGIYTVQTKKNIHELNVFEAIERAKQILSDIQHKKFNMPNDNTSSWRCKNLCYFHKSGQCEGVQKEQWRILNEKYNKGDKNES